MYVCHCTGLTDHEIEAQVAAGARTIEDLAECCGAGSECGGCWPALEEVLEHHSLLHMAHRELADAHR